MRTTSLSIIVSVAALALALAPVARASAEQATEIQVFSAYGSQGLHHDLRVSSHVSGSCWTQSITLSARIDAWRCMSGNQIHDPCFSAPSGHEVACVANPFDHRTVLISLSEPLPVYNRPLPPRTQPWGIKLSSTVRCVFLTGTTTVEEGMRENYGCGKGLAFGEPDRSGPVWHIFYKSSANASDLHRVPIILAVF